MAVRLVFPRGRRHTGGILWLLQNICSESGWTVFRRVLQTQNALKQLLQMVPAPVRAMRSIRDTEYLSGDEAHVGGPVSGFESKCDLLPD